MPSKTALGLVNDVLLTTGDYKPLTTVVGSPANIADRIIAFYNIVIADVSRLMDFSVMRNDFSAVGDGVTELWAASAGITSPSNSITSCTVDGVLLEYLSPAQYASQSVPTMRTGLPSIYTKSVAPTGEMQVRVFPIPPVGAVIELTSYNDPSPLTLIDTSTTELTGMDDVLLLGVLAHMDGYDQMQRGYGSMYSAAKNKLFTHHNRNNQIRITPESYS